MPRLLPNRTPLLPALVLVSALSPFPLAAQAVLVFADGFESSTACHWSSFVSPVLPGGCFIAGVCYDPGTDPANLCRYCDPISNPTGWLFTANGTPCTDGDFCTAGDSCSNGVCLPSGPTDCSDGIACTADTCDVGNQSCTSSPVDSACEDGLACTADTCGLLGCESVILPDACLIAGTCRANGELNPAQACQECNPGATSSGWSNRPAGVSCSTASCASGTVSNPADLCNGAGGCIDSGTQDCVPYTCSAGSGSCLASCTVNADCSAGNYCSASSCVPTKPLGAVCTGSSECSSNSCVDGVCCNSACGGVCQRCNTPGLLGSCTNNTAGTDPDNECSAQAPATCGTTGVCSGAASCTLYPAGITCVAASCASPTTWNPADLCNGTGLCLDSGTISCSPYICSGAFCLTTCAADSHCIGTHFCSGSSCTPRLPAGMPCSGNNQCVSNVCAGGFCT